MNPGPHRLRPFKKYTPAPLLFLKIVKTPAGVYSDTPAPVHTSARRAFFQRSASLHKTVGKVYRDHTDSREIYRWLWLVSDSKDLWLWFDKNDSDTSLLIAAIHLAMTVF